jgi:predicted Fe-Mo cluster-binding NifX family protein
MKLALAVWEGRISPVFDVSREILILSVEDGTIARTHREIMASADPVYRVSKLAELNVQTLICGAVSGPLAHMLAAYGIHTLPFTAGKVEEVVAAYLADALPNPGMSMPGCRGRCRRARQSALQESQREGRASIGERRGARQSALQESQPIKPLGSSVRYREQEERTMPNRDGTGPGGSGQGRRGCGGRQRRGGQVGQQRGQKPGRGIGQGRKMAQNPGDASGTDAGK